MVILFSETERRAIIASASTLNSNFLNEPSFHKSNCGTTFIKDLLKRLDFKKAVFLCRYLVNVFSSKKYHTLALDELVQKCTRKMARKRDLVWLISFTASKCRQPKEKGAWHVVFYTPIYRNMCAIWRITPQKRTNYHSKCRLWLSS